MSVKVTSLTESIANLPAWTTGVVDWEVAVAISVEMTVAWCRGIFYCNAQQRLWGLIGEMVELFQERHQSPDPHYWEHADFEKAYLAFTNDVISRLKFHVHWLNTHYHLSGKGTETLADLLKA